MIPIISRAARAGAAAVLLAALPACNNANLGDILGGVLGGGQQAQRVEGTIRAVSTNNQQITLQQTNGENVALSFDNNTAVIYQNQRYAVTNLEYGDRVVARVLNANGAYYTDSIFVTQSVGTSGSGTASGNVQSFTGRVGNIDRQNGAFVVDLNNGGAVTVSLPYNVSSGDLQRFQNLRSGDTARFYGVLLNNSRVELRQFY